jgi:hypothetical protein
VVAINPCAAELSAVSNNLGVHGQLTTFAASAKA